MNANAAQAATLGLPVLLRGEPAEIDPWVRGWSGRRFLGAVAVIVIGAGLYGAAMGSWRAPTQGFYTAVKFPLVILLVTSGNALLNGLLAPLLGIHMTLRQSFQAVLLSFVIACAILGAFSPVMGFLVLNTPPMEQRATAGATHSLLLLSQVVIIAFAGVVANLRLINLLEQWTGSGAVARRVVLAWLAGNLFFGSQLCWILRPFIGSPGLPVQFLRPDAFEGGFYDSVARALMRLLAG
jgi:hypothetical protein